MTREEAIKILQGIDRLIGDDFYSDTIDEAIEMAIEALSEETSTIQEKHQLSEETPTNTSTKSTNISTDASADRPSDEEDQLKFYYVESIDDYWIGMRIDNCYYADWQEGLGFVWSKSRYLPWGEHITDKTTLWKEHTYPSEPVEMPFTDWIVGFVKKCFADRPKGKWIDENGTYYANCSMCGYQMDTHQERGYFRYCPNCGAKMNGERRPK